MQPELASVLGHIVQVIMDSFPGLRPVSFAALCEKGRERAGPSPAFKGFTIIRPIRANDFVFDAVPVGECNRDRALPILDCGVTCLVHRPSVRAGRGYPSPGMGPTGRTKVSGPFCKCVIFIWMERVPIAG